MPRYMHISGSFKPVWLPETKSCLPGKGIWHLRVTEDQICLKWSRQLLHPGVISVTDYQCPVPNLHNRNRKAYLPDWKRCLLQYSSMDFGADVLHGFASKRSGLTGMFKETIEKSHLWKGRLPWQVTISGTILQDGKRRIPHHGSNPRLRWSPLPENKENTILSRKAWFNLYKRSFHLKTTT